MTQFEEAAKYAVGKLEKQELSETLGIMYETNCPLYMVGNNAIDHMRELLNEWGNDNGLKDFWWEKYGDEDAALYKGYEILEQEGIMQSSPVAGF